MNAEWMRLGVFFLGACVSNVNSAFCMTIVSDSKPTAVIVLSTDAPNSVKFAADELQSNLNKVSGAKLTIQKDWDFKTPAILVGESFFTKKLGVDTSGLQKDGFKIITKENAVVIIGNDYNGPPIRGIRNPWRMVEVYNSELKIGVFGNAGTLNGVYRFLEDTCDIRWYWPGELGAVMPTKKTIKIGKIDLIAVPDFEYRYPWLCNFKESAEDVRWFRRIGFGAPYPAQCIDSFHFLLKYKDTNPEYFAIIDGKRDFTNLSCERGGGNLCLSNPDVEAKWVELITEYFDKHPNQFVYPLGPNDGMIRICECEKCSPQADYDLGDQGKFSNYVWSFIDRVARGVAKKYPDKYVGGIAYANYKTPPTRIKKLSPNVIVMICQSRGEFRSAEGKLKAREAIDGWHAKTNNIYLWEYYLYCWKPWRGFPIPYPHAISDDLKYLKGISKGEFIEAESWRGDLPAKFNFPGMNHLNLYVTAKLYWDASLNVDDLLAEYYTKFYGPAAGEMKSFWMTAEKIWMASGEIDNPINLYTKEDLQKLNGYLKDALKKTPAESKYHKRIQVILDEFTPAKRKLSNTLVVNPPKLSLKESVSSPKIDGLLDDDMWKRFEPTRFVDSDGEEAKFTTWMYAGYDKKNLYFAIINYEPEIARLQTKVTERDGGNLWLDDAMEIFICPNPENRELCYQWVINAAGVLGDYARGVGEVAGADSRWNSKCEVKTKIEPNRWVMEIKIPLSDIGIDKITKNKSIAANFYRNRHCGQNATYSCWSPTLDWGHFVPERFGTISFDGK